MLILKSFRFSACNFGCGDDSRAKFGTKYGFIYPQVESRPVLKYTLDRASNKFESEQSFKNLSDLVFSQNIFANFFRENHLSKCFLYRDRD